MPIFAPFDPRGPDQRRKQLIAKLAGQAGAAQQAVSRTPMPGHLGATTLAEGRSFRGASASRIGGQAHVTQSPNILASVLARLGVSGKSHSEEMSAGKGLPITPPAPSSVLPDQQTGSAIPTPAMSGPSAAASTTSGTVPVQLASSGLPAEQAQIVTGPGELPSGPGDIYTTVDASGNPTTKPLVDPGFLMGGGANEPVPLGNGLYYDPSTGMVLGQQDVNPSIPAARLGRDATR